MDLPEMAGLGHPSNRARNFTEISLLRRKSVIKTTFKILRQRTLT